MKKTICAVAARCFLFFLVFFCRQSFADIELQSSPVRVIRHQPRGGIEMSPPQKDPLAVVPAIIFRGSGESEPRKITLPVCTSNRIREEEVPFTPGSLASPNILYFDPEDPSQAGRAQKMPGSKVALGGTEEPTAWAQFASALDLKCLPTRFLYATRGEKRYMQYREGATAYLPE